MSTKLIKILKFSVPVLLCAVIYLFIARESNSVIVVQPVQGPAVQAIYATGTVEPSVMVPIAAKNSALLKSLLADEGHTVQKGDILAQLEDAAFGKKLIEMQSLADMAEKEFKRRAALFKNKAVSEQAVQQARSDLDAAKARVEQAKANLTDMKLIAPENGLIIKRDGEIGELVPANEPVFWMSCCSGLRIAAEVDEEDITLVKPGQAVLIRADAFPGKTFNGTVQSITPKGDPISRSYRVRIALQKETPLMIGMTAETNIIVHEEKNAILIPASAMKEDTVSIYKNGKIEKRSVETGAKTEEMVEIRHGLDLGELVVKDISSLTPSSKRIKTKTEEWKAP